MKERSVLSNIAFNALKTMAGILFPFFSFPYAVRVLGNVNLGRVMYCMSIITYFSLFAELGISIYATREGVKYRNDRTDFSKFVKEILFINLISTIVSYMALIIMIQIDRFISYKTLLFICSLTIIFKTFQMDWLYQIVEDFKYISIRTTSLQIIALILLFLFVRDSNDYLQYTFITVFAMGGSFFLNLYNSRKYVEWKLRLPKINIKKHIKAILIIFGISAAAQIYLNLDIIMIGVIKGDGDVGYYSASVKLINAIKVVLASVSTAILARLSSYINEGLKDDFDQLISRSVNMILLLIIPTCFGIICLRREILYILYGYNYYDASFPLVFLSINMIFSVLDGVFYQQICLPLHLEMKACIATIIGAFVNLIMNLFFITIYGYNGAAFTTLLSEIVVFFLLLVSIRHSVDLKLLFKQLPQYFLGGIIMFGIIEILHKLISGIIIKSIIILGVGVFAYIYFLAIMKNIYVVSLIDKIKKNKRE